MKSTNKIEQLREEKQKYFLSVAKSYGSFIKNKLKKVTVVLYGSVVNGDFNSRSDIDILIISDSLPERFVDRFDKLLSDKFSIIEPKGYTKKEFLVLKNKTTYVRMLKNARVIRDDLKLFC